MRRISAKSLAQFIELYCRQHYHQVRVSAFARKLKNNHRQWERYNRSDPRRPETTNASFYFYSFFIAAIALKAMSRFNAMAEKKRCLTPIENHDIILFANRIVKGALLTKTTVAQSVVEQALQGAAGFTHKPVSGRFAAFEIPSSQARPTGYRIEREVQIYELAETKADQLFEAWLNDPRHPPQPDAESVAHHARAITSTTTKQGEWMRAVTSRSKVH